MHHPPFIPAHHPATLRPLPYPAQPHGDVLFLNPHASAANLFDTAQQRMAALGDLLHCLENSSSHSLLPEETARVAAALGLLLAEARALYEAAYERAREDRPL
ncbi:hypothetical protein [Metapseudomonas resinovorans]|uniref:Uncharacterized protein n=1 Tax=Metapseudomonas resinovorans NBRC 106553 TaxID=1245471 RepID=S6AX12_METRE|nr:hypothetical protein [Pseudomonas resinovorans]BAN49136.1 hypothetical protein PCA10_34040 [Pseudomonas resinovorans NBRC 106553]